MTALTLPFPRQPKKLSTPPFFTFLLDFLTGLVYAVTHADPVRQTVANAVVDALDAGAGAGTFEFLTSASAEVATLTFGDPAFGAASATGVATANAITGDASATGGTTDRFRTRDSDSNDVFFGSVGAPSSGEDVEISAVVVAATDAVDMTSLLYTAMP